MNRAVEVAVALGLTLRGVAGRLGLASALLLSSLAGPLGAERCPPGNLLQGAAVEGQGLAGEARVLTDGLLTREGMPWDAPQALQLRGPAAFAVIDLGRTTTLRALLIQADQNDGYAVEASQDGWSWAPAWRAPPVPGAGLQTRQVTLPAPLPARYLRVRGQGGDGRYSIAEVRAYCEVPDASPPRFEPTARGGGPSRTTIAVLKGVVSGLGALLFLWGLVLRRAGRDDLDRRLRAGLLLTLGLLAAGLWWNLGRFNFEGYLHLWEQYHYFVGSKYAPELGHTRLYACTAVADVEAGLGPQMGARKIRNLETNRLEPATVALRDPAACKTNFTAERWEAFRGDVDWFRQRMPAFRWALLARDHGYNASPMWEALGGRLANLGPASERLLIALALIDPVLLLVMWGFVLWAFGWRATALALLWWGTNYVADFTWVGGAFLRQDWLALSVVGICLVRRDRPFAGGILLTWATLLRVFPGFIIAGLLLQAIAVAVSRRRLVPSAVYLRFAGGCLVALAVLLPLSFTARGPGAWIDFARNSRVHLATPGSNTIGLGAVTAYAHETRLERTRNPELDDPDREWKRAHHRTAARRAPLRWGLAGLFVILLAAATRRHDPWVALALGVALIPLLTVQAGYYYTVLLVWGLLSVRREAVGALLCLLSLWTVVAWGIWTPLVQYDQRFTWISLAVVLTAVLLTAIVWRGAGERPA